MRKTTFNDKPLARLRQTIHLQIQWAFKNHKREKTSLNNFFKEKIENIIATKKLNIEKN